MKTSEPKVIVSQEFDASVQKVWDAITKNELMKDWYFDNIPAFDATVGFKTEFLIVHNDRRFLHQWEITEVIPNKKLVYRWQFEGYEGDSYVSFELKSQNNKTVLTLTVTVTEDFSDDIEEFRRDSCVAGWKYFINQNLKQYLDG